MRSIIIWIILIFCLLGCNEKHTSSLNEKENNSSLNFDRLEIDDDPKIVESLEKFQDRKFGFFVHWGIYSQWGAVASWPLIEKFEDTRDYGPAFAERDHDFKRYFTDYYNLNKTFNPQKFDPEQWADAAESAGMKYFIMVTKHHDGFCMFDTKQTGFSITGQDCPYHTNPNANVTKVLFDAFRKKGFSVGTYFSKPDWSNKDYWAPEFPHPDHSVNYDPRRYPEKWNDFKDFTYNQIQELMTEYGPIDILWLDGAQVTPVANQDIDMDRIAKMARKNQPGLLIVDRLAEGKYENYLTPENFHSMPDKPLSKPWELNASLGNGWSHRINDVFKPSKEIIDVLIETVAKGGNLLLDVGPPASGKIPADALKSMKEIGDWLKINGEGIYKTRRFDYFKENDHVYYTKSKDGKIIYALCLAWPNDSLKLTKLIPNKNSKIQLLGSDRELEWEFNDGVLKIDIPEEIKNTLNHSSNQAYVFRIEGSAAKMLEEVVLKCVSENKPDTYLFTNTYTFELTTSTPDAQIYYTLDGTEPNENSPVYNQKISINATTVVKAIAKQKAYTNSPVITRKLTKIKKLNQLSFINKWNSQYSNANADVLYDLRQGTLDHTNGEWLGFEQKDFIGTVDLGKKIPIKKISIGFLKNVYESIFVPDSVNFYISDDGEKFNAIGSVKYDISPFEQAVYVKNYVLDSISNSTRYIKIEAKNMGTCPHPHFNSGGKAWLYLDEIMIE